MKQLISRFATLSNTLIGLFFILLSIGAIASGDILSAIIVSCGGILLIPYIRDRIANATDTKRIRGSVAVVIAVVLLVVGMSIASPIESVVTDSQHVPTPIVTPNPTPIMTPKVVATPKEDIITTSAIKMLPLGKELGDKSGWRTKNSDDNTCYIAERSYYKEHRTVTITIYVFDNNREAKTIYDKVHNKFGYDEYPTFGVGDMSLIYTMSASNSLHEHSYGCFVNKNVFVSIVVDDYWIYEHEMKVYARQVNRKM